MAFISLKWFAGMIPRLGRQHLSGPHATEAENCNLYSGELRPLKKPALAHQFCKPDDKCFQAPIPNDPSVPPEPPPEPPKCVSAYIITQPTNAEDWSLVEEGTPLTLSVEVNADATTPVQYQWLRNSIALAGEVSSVLTVAVQPEDSYASYTVYVQNPCGDELSQPFSIGVVVGAGPCIYYTCDAYETTLGAIAEKLWLFHDPATNADQLATDGEQLFRAGTINAAVPILQDQCGDGGQSLAIASGAQPYYLRDWNSTPPFDFGSGLSGGVGAFFRANDTRGGNMIGIGYDEQYNQQVALQVNQGASEIAVFWTNGTYGITSADVANKYIWMNYDWATDGLSLTVEFFVDWVSLGTQVLPWGNPGNPAVPNEVNPTHMRVGGLGGSGSYDMEYVAYSSSWVTAEQAAELADALARNRPDYVDPNPGCIPPVCRQYECNAVAQALSGTTCWYDYTIGGPVPSLGVNDVITAQGATPVDITVLTGYANNNPEYPATVLGPCSGFEWQFTPGKSSHQSPDFGVSGPEFGWGGEGYTFGMVFRSSASKASYTEYWLQSDSMPAAGNYEICNLGEQLNSFFVNSGGDRVTWAIPSAGLHVVIGVYTRDPTSPPWPGGTRTSQIIGYMDGVYQGENNNCRSTQYSKFKRVAVDQYNSTNNNGLYYTFFDNRPWSAEEVTAFQETVEQNKSTYTDPITNCREP